MSHPSASAIPLFLRAHDHADRFAVAAPEGVFTYRELLIASDRVARRLLVRERRSVDRDSGAGWASGVERDSRVGRSAAGGSAAAELAEARVAYLVPPGFSHVAVQWGIWRAGGVAVPLAESHPLPEWARVLDDARPETVVAGPETSGRIRPLAEERGIALRTTGELGLPLRGSGPAGASGPVGPSRSTASLPALAADRRALIVYTSGTTGTPKGVVHTHATLEAQVRSLVEAWEWTADDHILLTLPLHHVHGIVNVLTCALWSGACCQILPSFDAEEVWERLARGDLTLFMAVPTVYHRLIRAWEEADGETRNRWSEGARGLRLTVSGSAALPVRTLERWREITGHTLLERYGMTEIGMGLGNPMDEDERRPAHVGRPFPGIEVRRVDEEGRVVEDPSEPAELEVRGPTVFREYWDRPEETEAAFHDGWFRTGDVAVIEDGHYRLLGRKGVDILKTGGYKVSALEVEEALREHPAVEACAVVGVPDEEWGERVVAAVVPPEGEGGSPEGAAGPRKGLAATASRSPGPEALAEELRAFLRARLAPYKVPKEIRIVEALPRNAVGKVRKPAVVEGFVEGRGAADDREADREGEGRERGRGVEGVGSGDRREAAGPDAGVDEGG